LENKRIFLIGHEIWGLLHSKAGGSFKKDEFLKIF